MIQLFNIPTYKIDTADYSNLLHDKIVREFEERLAEYVGAKHCVTFNSATNAIFLALLGKHEYVSCPSIIPPVVPNAIRTSGNSVLFVDDVDWVGGSYVLWKEQDNYKIVDSAQRLDRNQFKLEADDNDLMVFSFYPTKPVGSCDGGAIVSNDKDKIEKLRELSFNGMTQAENNWERKLNSVGYKCYMNSIQAQIALWNLEKLDKKKEAIAEVRDYYNRQLGLKNTSDHLYRIRVKDNREFIAKAKEHKIMCGIHYEAIHHNALYHQESRLLPKSDIVSRETVSIPMHEELKLCDIHKITRFVHEYSEV